MEIVQRNPEHLRPLPNNAKKHTKEQIARIAQAITKNGMLDPIEITKDDIILSGHGRWLAAKMLNMDRVPCIVHEISDAAANVYSVATNSTLLETGMDVALVAENMLAAHVPMDDAYAMGFQVADLTPYFREDAAVVPSESPAIAKQAKTKALPRLIFRFYTEDEKEAFAAFIARLRNVCRVGSSDLELLLAYVHAANKEDTQA